MPPNVASPTDLDPESLRLQQDAARQQNWKRWGPYLSERQWGTVREDYSPDGDCWNYFPHDHARSRAYRWGEDGILGICDRECRLCFALALWNGKDSILKERLFGLTNPEGNHGEDVKECYYYLDSTPTHSYMKALYKYPQAAFPYQNLIEENARRGKSAPEYELTDTGVFDDERYFDVFAEYAKNTPDDILILITIANRGPEAAELHLLPTLWFRNSWSWGCTHEGCTLKPRLSKADEASVIADHPTLGRFRWEVQADVAGATPRFLFTDNETNVERLYAQPNTNPYVKDAFHRHVINQEQGAIDRRGIGTKVAAWYRLTIPAGQQVSLHMRLFPCDQQQPEPLQKSFDAIFAQRRAEADGFWRRKIHCRDGSAEQQVARQAYAGLLWSRQFYHYVISDWLDGDPDEPPPPAARKTGRNSDWRYFFARDVLSMPDKWEYPWFAAWDLAFHMVPFASVDAQFAKDQLLLLLREWYTHASGQLPAYEFNFGDVNPPVHAWACWRVYKITGQRGHRDVQFLERAFQKLMINFTWWVNRKDIHGKHLFSGGFLGLDNIGLFDRSKPLPNGMCLEQADGTAWMAFYCGTMLSMALELASHNAAYEDIASKFFEHYVAIVDAMNSLGGNGLWDENDGFYYDQALLENGQTMPLRVRSMVGIIPLFACEILESNAVEKLEGFSKRLRWFLEHRHDLARHISYMQKTSADGKSNGNASARYLLSIPSKERLERVLRYVLNEKEFFSPFGVRSLSRFHLDHPCEFAADSQTYAVSYEPAESKTSLFGGNSNWRGPVWFPPNFLLIEAMERYHHFYGDDFKVECPTGSGTMMTLKEVAVELTRRLSSLFLPDAQGLRPYNGGDERMAETNWRDLLLFHEYFDGDNGRGCGASHQTGWTALVARLVQRMGQRQASSALANAPAMATQPVAQPSNL